MHAALNVRPLSSKFGVEILDVDLREEPAQATQRALFEAWVRHSLLVFRNQQLDAEQQQRGARVFGTVSSQGRDGGTGMNYVSNVVENGTNPRGELGFHQDHLHFSTPLRGVMLYAIEVPPEGAGGDTLFSDGRMAYRLLPEALRQRIDGLQIRHGERVTNVPGKGAVLVENAEAQRADHPLAFTHPDSGEKTLLLSGRHVDRILGMTAEESRELIDTLRGYIGLPETTVRHVWRPGDLVLWDNLALQHARTDFDPQHHRHLRRLQIV